jgi:dihydroorotase
MGRTVIELRRMIGWFGFVVLGASFCLPVGAQDATYDLLLKGGHVIDPANQLDQPMDVAIAGDRIAAVAANIPAEDARRVVDVAGHYVTPGFIDLHAHAQGSRIVGRESIPPSLHFASGATTVVDAGTWGALDFRVFKETVVETTPIRVLALLNIVSRGMSAQAAGSFEQSVDLMDPELCAATIQENRDILVGVKTAHYWTSRPWDSAHPPWAAVERAVEAGRIADVPVMVDFWPRPPERSYSELILEKLRPGDIHTHVFAQQFPILDAEGHVQDYLRQARERGVIFDLGHGAGSFWFRNAAPAVQQGFLPDTISTDLHMGNVNGPVVDFITTMSKMLALGVPLEDLVRRATVNPARVIHRPELGTLTVGGEADVAVVELLHGKFGYTDCGRAKMIGKVKLANRLTLRAGRIVYDPTGLSMVEWQKAPPRYFTTPKLQGVDPAAIAEPDAK